MIFIAMLSWTSNKTEKGSKIVHEHGKIQSCLIQIPFVISVISVRHLFAFYLCNISIILKELLLGSEMQPYTTRL